MFFKDKYFVIKVINSAKIIKTVYEIDFSETLI